MHNIDLIGEFNIPVGSPIVSRGGITNGVKVAGTSFATLPTVLPDEMIGVVSARAIRPAHEATTAEDEDFDTARAARRAIAAA